MTRNHVQCTMIMYNALCKAGPYMSLVLLYIVKKWIYFKVQKICI